MSMFFQASRAAALVSSTAVLERIGSDTVLWVWEFFMCSILGAALSKHPEIQMMSFTGSTRAGIAITKAIV